MITSLPFEKVNEETGVRFWTTPKRFPCKIEYDSGDEVIISFIHSAANIFAFILGLKKIGKE